MQTKKRPGATALVTGLSPEESSITYSTEHFKHVRLLQLLDQLGTFQLQNGKAGLVGGTCEELCEHTRAPQPPSAWGRTSSQENLVDNYVLKTQDIFLASDQKGMLHPHPSMMLRWPNPWSPALSPRQVHPSHPSYSQVTPIRRLISPRSQKY